MRGAAAVRRLLPVLAAAAAALALVCARPAGAPAHAFLLSSAPGQAQLLPTPPTQISLVFSEGFDVVETRVTANGASVAGGPPSVRPGNVLVLPVRPGAPDGAYQASWRIVSADGHPVAGSLVFSVGDTAVAAPVTPTIAADAGTAADTAAIVVRTLHLGGLLVLLGGLAFAYLVWVPLVAAGGAPPASDAAFWRAAGRVGLVALGALALGAVLVLPVHRWQTGLGIGDAIGTQFGRVAVGRLALLPVAALGVSALRTRSSGRAAAALAGLGGLAVLPALAGHPSTSATPVQAVVGQWLHLATAALWTGGVAMLATAVVAAARAAPERGVARAAVVRFGPVALLAVGGLGLTGALYVWQEVDGLAQLRSSDWGIALGVKTTLVVVALALGGLVRRGIAAVRPGTRAELVALGLVVVATAILVGLAPPRPGTASGTVVQPDVPTASQSVVIGADEVLWSITPASAETRGELHMIAVDAKTGQPAQDVTDATVSLVGPDGAAADVPLQKLDVAHWTAPVVLGPPGRYTLRISLGTGDFDVETGESALVVQ